MIETPYIRRWGGDQRIEFIEFKLFWEGGLNRADLIDFFGVSVPQASNDLSAYREIAGDNLIYNARLKRYVASDTFAPKVYKPNADRYLAQLKGLSDGIIHQSDTWIKSAPEATALPVPQRRIDPFAVRRLLAAMRNGQSIEIFYHSMSPAHPEPVWRRITPHAFGHDGLRWHVRARCHRDGAFKDFILSRCRDLRDEGEGMGTPQEDQMWHEVFTVELIPNPDLTPSQQETIALDYGMVNGKVRVPVRRALLYYFEKRLRLDVAPGQDLPRERPVVVANWADFRDAFPKAW